MASSTMIMHSNINLFVAILKEKKKIKNWWENVKQCWMKMLSLFGQGLYEV